MKRHKRTQDRVTDSLDGGVEFAGQRWGSAQTSTPLAELLTGADFVCCCEKVGGNYSHAGGEDVLLQR